MMCFDKLSHISNILSSFEKVKVNEATIMLLQILGRRNLIFTQFIYKSYLIVKIKADIL